MIASLFKHNPGVNKRKTGDVMVPVHVSSLVLTRVKITIWCRGVHIGLLRTETLSKTGLQTYVSIREQEE